jgi:hypothetical protein
MFIFVVLPFPKVSVLGLFLRIDFPVCNFFYNRVDLFIRRKKTE